VPSRDQYADLAHRRLPQLTEAELSRLYQSADALEQLKQSAEKLMVLRDAERSSYIKIVSALLDLAGGQAVIPPHALANAPGYQIAHGQDGDLILQSAGR
jgi:hypothetical protein